jgi:molecular chaperone HtpG
VDATQKLKTLAGKGEYKGELGELKVEVIIDKEAGTLTVRDRGIGMTADEIEKYINQIAFSGAGEFLEKYKDAEAIIGHFGLGFYSSFMVSDRVDILTKSWQDAPAQKWSCDGSPEFTLEEIDKADRGTDIVMHLSDDCKEFLEKGKVEQLLSKYCHFLPVPVVLGNDSKWDEKEKKMVETDADHVINSVAPLWMRKPSELKDDDYKEFYDQHFAPLEVPEDLQIDNPTDLKILDPDELDEELETTDDGEQPAEEEDDDFPFGF